MDNLGDDIDLIDYRDILSEPREVQFLVLRWRNSDHVRHQMLNSSIITEEEHARWLDSLSGEPKRQVVRVAHLDGVPFGVVTLKDLDRESLRCDWGMYIGEREYLGRGLAKRMLFHLMDWAFDEEGLERMYTSVVGSNVGAISMYLKFGFKVEGRFERHIRSPQGSWEDLYWMATFREDWFGRRARMAEMLDGLSG
ncbi:GCN5-related N-acetyltransferase [Thermanaerovibrio acidaminovorans DSM 6589]|uniref:GCN5-related N-acetyltransferase n=1 Tax=Thermanaerovibrio acidaminovorans (strain ATCC 49978 / DSM 6589 / Su883) TaxID=525903 RepID=D1B9C7_THEAS|nr:GCN5-related N-acetyltransferase [Thermanaerovibrio acidaminovorans DSM 6589]